MSYSRQWKRPHPGSVDRLSLTRTVQFISVPSPIGSSGGFSRDPLLVFTASGPCEQVWHGQGCPLFDVVCPEFPLPTTASPTLQSTLKDGVGETVVACDMPEHRDAKPQGKLRIHVTEEDDCLRGLSEAGVNQSKAWKPRTGEVHKNPILARSPTVVNISCVQDAVDSEAIFSQTRIINNCSDKSNRKTRGVGDSRLFPPK